MANLYMFYNTPTFLSWLLLNPSVRIIGVLHSTITDYFESKSDIC
jgi:hypothetical protein